MSLKRHIKLARGTTGLQFPVRASIHDVSLSDRRGAARFEQAASYDRKSVDLRSGPLTLYIGSPCGLLPA
jgi:hypothetical protein